MDCENRACSSINKNEKLKPRFSTNVVKNGSHRQSMSTVIWYVPRVHHILVFLTLAPSLLFVCLFYCCFGVAGTSCRVSGRSFQGGGGFQDNAKGACTFRVPLPFVINIELLLSPPRFFFLLLQSGTVVD
jgi:hypothetical protein